MRRLPVFVVPFLLLSCTKLGFDPSQVVDGSRPLNVTAEEASRRTYQYAFSGQILEEKTKAALPHFSVEIAGNDPSISAVINPLGDHAGIFHISRNPASAAQAYATVPIIISAPGHEPVVQMLDLGSDCQTSACPGSRPTIFSLRKLPDLTAKRGKIDSVGEGLLSRARENQTLSNVIIFLSGNPGSETARLIRDLFSAAKVSKIPPGTLASLAPLLAVSHPQFATSLIATNPILPYLSPIAERLASGKSGVAGQFVGNLLKEKNYQDNMLTLVAALSGKSTAPRTMLAMTSLLPIVDGILESAQPSTHLVSQLVNSGLADAGQLNLLMDAKHQREDAFATAIRSLVEGFAGKQGASLIAAFNTIVKRDGLLALKNFKPSAKTAQLNPYLEPLTQALNSSSARVVAQGLAVHLKSKNPGQSLLNWVEITDRERVTQLVGAWYPGMAEMLSQAIPGKQIFAAQLIHGLVNGDYRDLKVTNDLKGSPAVIIAGQPRDIVKLTQLANVEKIVVLPSEK